MLRAKYFLRLLGFKAIFFPFLFNFQLFAEDSARKPRALGFATEDNGCAANLSRIVSNKTMMSNSMQSAMKNAESRMFSFLNGPGSNLRSKVAQEQRSYRARELSSVLPFLESPALQPAFRRAVDSDLSRRSTALMNRLRKAATDGKLDREAQVYDVVNIGGGPHDVVAMAKYSEVNPNLKALTVTSDGEYASTFNTSGFRLNSPSRPGLDGRPAAPGVDDLNKLPGSLAQIPMISGDRYPVAQSLSDVATVNRYVQDAPIMFNSTVTRIDDKFRSIGARSRTIEPEFPARYRINFSNGTFVYANAINEVSGLGRKPKLGFLFNSKQISDAIDQVDNDIERGLPPSGRHRIFTGRSFFRWSDDFEGSRAELSGRRVAVIGGGDTSSTVNESLFGLGPVKPGQATQDGQVSRVDWIGQKNADCKTFIENTRSRYGGLVNPIKSGAIQATPLQLADVINPEFRRYSDLSSGPYTLVLKGRIPPKSSVKQRTEIYKPKELIELKLEDAREFIFNQLSIPDIRNTNSGADISSPSYSLAAIMGNPPDDLKFFKSVDPNGNPVFVIKNGKNRKSDSTSAYKTLGLEEIGEEAVISARQVDAIIFGTGFEKDDSIYRDLTFRPKFTPVEGKIEKPEGTKNVFLGTRLANDSANIPPHEIYRSGPGAGPELIPDDETASAGKKGKQRVKANKVSLFNWTPRTEEQARLIAERATLKSVAETSNQGAGKHFDEPSVDKIKIPVTVRSSNTPGTFSFYPYVNRTYRGLVPDATGDSLFMEASVASRLSEFDLRALDGKDLEIRFRKNEEVNGGNVIVETNPPLDSDTVRKLADSFADDPAFNDGLKRNIKTPGSETFIFKAEIDDGGKIIDTRVSVVNTNKVKTKVDRNTELNKLLEATRIDRSPAYENLNILTNSNEPYFRAAAYDKIADLCKSRDLRAEDPLVARFILRGLRDAAPEVRKSAIKALEKTPNVYFGASQANSAFVYYGLRSKFPEVRAAALELSKTSGVDPKKGPLSYYSKKYVGNPLSKAANSKAGEWVKDVSFIALPVSIIGVGGVLVVSNLVSSTLSTSSSYDEDRKNEANKNFPDFYKTYKERVGTDLELIAVKDEDDGRYDFRANSKDDLDSYTYYGEAFQYRYADEDVLKKAGIKIFTEEKFKEFEEERKDLKEIDELVRKNKITKTSDESEPRFLAVLDTSERFFGKFYSIYSKNPSRNDDEYTVIDTILLNKERGDILNQKGIKAIGELDFLKSKIERKMKKSSAK